jgi:hypothetical protein
MDQAGTVLQYLYFDWNEAISDDIVGVFHWY